MRTSTIYNIADGKITDRCCSEISIDFDWQALRMCMSKLLWRKFSRMEARRSARKRLRMPRTWAKGEEELVPIFASLPELEK
jgi:hypothetical protein